MIEPAVQCADDIQMQLQHRATQAGLVQGLRRAPGIARFRNA